MERDLEARIEGALLANGAHRVALIVVRRIDQRLVGQLQKASEQRLVLRARIAVLEIRASGAADQQRIAGEHAVGQKIAVGIVGVARRIGDVEGQAFDADAVAVGDADRHDVGLGLLAHDGDAFRALAERLEPGDVVGVQMRVDGLDQAQVELAQELDVAVDALEHGIDDQRLAAMPAREQIGVGA